MAGLSATVVGGAPLVARRVVGGENAVALQQLIAQQQAALVQRLAGKAPPGAAGGLGGLGLLASTGSGAIPAPSPTAAAGVGVAGAAAAGATAVGSEVGGQQQQQPVEERGVGLVVVQLENMVERDELLDDEEYEDLLEDTRGEVAKYGELVQVRMGA